MKRNIGSATRVAAAVALALCMAGSALAGPLERAQAKRIHDRIAGMPPTESVLNTMEALIVGGDAAGAAREAMKARTFYTTTLKNWVTPWTNRDQTVFAPLNDYTATVIGMVRDDVDFRQVLSGDILYVGGTGLPAAATAGVITTRGAAQAFFVAGTNRAMFRFTMINHMCKDMEQVHDVNLPPDRIRQ